MRQNDSSRNVNLIKLALVLAEVLAAVAILGLRILTPHEAIVFIVIVLILPWILWLKSLKTKKALGYSFLAMLCSLAMAADLAIHKFFSSFVFSLIFLIFLYRIWRSFNRTIKVAGSPGLDDSSKPT
jgi:hypothetical protein